MAPKSKITQSTAVSSKKDTSKAPTKPTRGDHKQPITTPVLPTLPAPSLTPISVPANIRRNKRTIRDFQENSIPTTGEVTAPATKKPRVTKPVTASKTAPKAATKPGPAIKEEKQPSVKISGDLDSGKEKITRPPPRRSARQTTVAPISKTTARKHAEALPPSRKRRASADVPTPSIEKQAPTVSKRVGRSKRVKIEKPAAVAPKPPKAKPKGKGKVKAKDDPAILEEEEEEEEYIEFDFVHVGRSRWGETQQPSVADVAVQRTTAFATFIAYERNKRRAPGTDQAAFLDRLVRKRKAFDTMSAPVAAPPSKKQKLPAVSTPNVAVASTNKHADPAPVKRVRRPRRELKKPSTTPAVPASPSKAVSPRLPKEQKRKALQKEVEAPVVVEDEGEDEDEEAWEHPPILSRTPSPEPGEEREPIPDGDDPDGLYAPSVLTTIPGPDGRRYREFRKKDAETGEEKVFWIPVKERAMEPRKETKRKKK